MADSKWYELKEAYLESKTKKSYHRKNSSKVERKFKNQRGHPPVITDKPTKHTKSHVDIKFGQITEE